MTATEAVVGELPFVVRRRARWGECDPAGVVYTVRFGEYVISAWDLFRRSILGPQTPESGPHGDFGSPIRALELDFRRSLWPDEEFEMTVSVRDIRSRSYVLGISARLHPTGEEVFRSVLTPVCIAADARRPIEIPSPFRLALERYRNATSTEASAAG